MVWMCYNIQVKIATFITIQELVLVQQLFDSYLPLDPVLQPEPFSTRQGVSDIISEFSGSVSNSFKFHASNRSIISLIILNKITNVNSRI